MIGPNDFDWTPIKWLVSSFKIDWTLMSELTGISTEELERVAETCPFTEEDVKSMYITGSSAWMHMLNLYVLIATLPSDQNIVELGAYVGISAKFFLAALHKERNPIFHSVDLAPFGVRIVSTTISKELTTPAQSNGFVERASLLTEEEKKGVIGVVDNAIGWLNNYDGPPFNFAFEDTDHTYPTTRAILEALIPHMKPGGIIVSHDVVMDKHLKDMPEIPPVNKAWDDVFGDYIKFNGMAFIKI